MAKRKLVDIGAHAKELKDIQERRRKANQAPVSLPFLVQRGLEASMELLKNEFCPETTETKN